MEFNNLHVNDDCIFYEGVNHYYIFKSEKHYDVVTEKLVNNGEDMVEKRFSTSTLSGAIAIIEDMENGKEV